MNAELTLIAPAAKDLTPVAPRTAVIVTLGAVVGPLMGIVISVMRRPRGALPRAANSRQQVRADKSAPAQSTVS